MHGSPKRLGALTLAAALMLAMAAPTAASNLGRISWSPSSISFGKVQVASNVVKTVWVTNGLRVPALISAESIAANTDQFQEIGGTTNDCFDKLVNGILLNPGETCGWRIRFEPLAAGAYSTKFIAVLSPSPDLSYTVTVSLRGTGY